MSFLFISIVQVLWFVLVSDAFRVTFDFRFGHSESFFLQSGRRAHNLRSN